MIIFSCNQSHQIKSGNESFSISLGFIDGTHPGSSISFVLAVGMEAKMVAYGNNRADYSCIAGGIVPGVLILPPDFPEIKKIGRFVGRE